jgi:acetyltransferase
MIHPRTVALIGATDREGSVGKAVLENLVLLRDGKVYPVNPHRKDVVGLKCWPSISRVPERADLAVIATPAATVPALVEECGRSGVHGIVVISAGFKETGEEGMRLEREIEAIRREYGMRIIGPNCLGLIRPGVSLNTSFFKVRPEKGKIAFISQSGALGAAVLEWATSAHIGFSLFASLGSMIDVDLDDLIDFLGGDDQTRSIIIYMETVGNAKKFMSAARGCAQNKPIVVVKSGIYPESARAAYSHTGAPPGDDEVYDAAFRRVGLVRVDQILDLFNAAQILDSRHLPRGNRLAVITNSGGPGVMAADALIRFGGRLAPLSEVSLKELDACLPGYWSKANPVDILGDADAKRYAKAADICLKDPNVDGLLVINVPEPMGMPEDVARSVVEAAKKTWNPVLAAWIGGDEVATGRKLLLENDIPVYGTPEEAVRTYLHMCEYKRNLELLYETPSELPVERFPFKSDLKALIQHAVRREGRTLLTEEEAKTIVSAYGIPVASVSFGRDAGTCTGSAAQADYPVLLKLASKRDKEFGSVILFGMGGPGAEVFRDIAIGLPPLNQTLARRLMEGTRVFKLLQGFEDRPPADLDQLEQILVTFSNLIVDFPEILEVDLNPIAISEGRACVLNARILLDPNPPMTTRLHPHLVIAPYPEKYVTPWRLPDGTEVVLRPVRPEDEPLEREMLATLSQETLTKRFFRSIREITHEMLVRFCNIDYDREMGLVAEMKTDDTKRIIGIAGMKINPDSQTGELAVLVHDAFQKRGLGYKLVEMLVEIGKEKGLSELHGYVLTENRDMLRVARHLGFISELEPGGLSVLTMRLR